MSERCTSYCWTLIMRLPVRIMTSSFYSPVVAKVVHFNPSIKSYATAGSLNQAGTTRPPPPEPPGRSFEPSGQRPCSPTATHWLDGFRGLIHAVAIPNPAPFPVTSFVTTGECSVLGEVMDQLSDKRHFHCGGVDHPDLTGGLCPRCAARFLASTGTPPEPDFGCHCRKVEAGLSC